MTYMNFKAQGALEYLLLIGGAVLVAAIVISLISTTPTAADPTLKTRCLAQKNYSACITTTGCIAMQSDMATSATDSSNFFICMAGENLCDNGTPDPGETCDTPGSEVGMGSSVLCNSTCSGYDVTGCATLSQPGNYKLTQNIGSTLNCLTISNNVGGNRTIDCQSRIISDPAATKIYRGINMVNAQNVTIQNCKVTGYATGIYTQNSSNITLSGNNGYNNRYGSAFFGSGITLNNCTTCNNNNNDIYCSGSTITGTGNIATNPSALCPDIFSDCP